MRIAVISPGYAPEIGGVETVVTRTAQELAALGHDVEVWTQQRGATLPPLERIDGVEVHRFPSTTSTHYPVSLPLWRHVRGQAAAVDVVHAHSYHSAAALALLAAPHSAAIVYSPHFHGDGHTAPARVLHRVYRPLARRLVARAAAVLAVSEAEATLLRQRLPGTADRLRVVPHGVDAARFGNAPAYADKPPTVVVVGRLERYKRIDTVLDAMAATTAQTQLVVIGDGPHREQLQRRAEQLGLTHRVRWLGRVADDVRDRWLRTAGVVVSLSEHEAFGLVALEAAAAGAHVVLSDLPAHREVARLLPATATTIVDATRPRDVATALTRALAAPAGAVAVRSWGDVAADYVSVYESLLPAARTSLETVAVATARSPSGAGRRRLDRRRSR